jgi:quercetin dioxygenase-like cupin family protein
MLSREPEYRRPMKPDPCVVWMPGRVRTEVHLVGSDTNGAFCLLVDHPPAGWSLPAHLHRGAAETIYVLEGEFEMSIDGQSSVLQAGHAVHVPADVIHSSANVGPRTGRRMVLFSPAGMERFFLEVGAPNAEIEIDLRAAGAAAARHGWQFTTT